MKDMAFNLFHNDSGFMDPRDVIYSDILLRVMDYLPKPETELYYNDILLELILQRNNPYLLQKALDKGIITDVDDAGVNFDGSVRMSLPSAVKLKSPELLYILINAVASQQNIDAAWSLLQSIRRGNDDYYYGIKESDEIVKARERGEHLEDEREREMVEILSPYVGNRKIC